MLLAVGLAVASLLACSPRPDRPKPITHDKSLPTCDALAPVLTSLGMSRPEVQPPSRSNLAPTEINCPFALPEPITAPGIASATVIAVRPDTDPYEGVPLQKWGETFVSSYECEGLKRPAPSVPQGTFCYEPNSVHSGSATLVGFPQNSYIRVRVQWWDPDATDVGLRTTAEQKTDDLAQRLIAML
ncbi:hypothetical protein ACFP2T_37520 [Plantactinospora solaniradicis]|uniref:DUF3558 domain-containing protein n=1 Tax=Plantactinospora solaniradicis TaxID=1723736 RepID=A0ABW1KLG9_9ACTN